MCRDALEKIYTSLNMDDVALGLRRRFCQIPDSLLALTLETYGYWDDAQDSYYRTIRQLHSGQIPSNIVDPFELRLWEERWVECSKQLGHWEMLSTLATVTCDTQLQLDCAEKLADWNVVKSICGGGRNSMLLSEDGGGVHAPLYSKLALEGWDVKYTARNLITSIYATLHTSDGCANELRSLHHARNLLLEDWQKLPTVVSNTHVPLLQQCHMLVECDESMNIISKVSLAQHTDEVPDLKNILSTWRERLPNKWERVSIWDDLLTFRSHTFTSIMKNFYYEDALRARLQDAPWTVIKLAQVARRQGLCNMALHVLGKLFRVSTMDVQDAFEKLREQILICYNAAGCEDSNRSTDLDIATAGLNTINSTNLEWFSANQKSELFRLKGLFLSALGDNDQANIQFSRAMQIDNKHSKCWLSWGRYLDSVYKKSKGDKNINVAAQAVCCYLQAVNHKTEGARLVLARVLWLMSNDDEKGTIKGTFQKYGDRMPLWIWIIWIPQLLTALVRPEAPKVRSIMLHLATVYPQSLYYTLRAFLLEKREIPKDKNDEKEKKESIDAKPKDGKESSSAQLKPMDIDSKDEKNAPTKSSPSEKPTRIDSVKYAEELVAYIRRAHPALASEIERMLEELIVRFKPSPEEELESAVHALLAKCFQLPHSADNKSIPVSLCTTLKRVCRKFFAESTSIKSPKHRRFVMAYKEPFEMDLLPILNDVESPEKLSPGEQRKNPEFPSTLEGVINNLRRWKIFLRCRVRELPSVVRMHSSSRYLAEFCSHLIEVPGQYIEEREPKPKLHVKAHRFEQDVHVLHRHGFSQRRIGILGSNGKKYYFLVQFAIPHITRTDERMVQLRVFFNRLLNKHEETRRRSLTFHSDAVVPITPRVRLVRDYTSSTSLENIVAQSLATRSRAKELNLCMHDTNSNDYTIENEFVDADEPIMEFRKIQRMLLDSEANKSDSSNSSKETSQSKHKLRAFRQICKKMPPDILQRFLARSTKTVDELFSLRHTMAKQLGLSSFLCNVLSIGDRVPHRFGLSLATGTIITSEFRPNYNHNGLLDTREAVPFRLTRNLQVALGDFLIDGVMSSAIATTAMCLESRKELVDDYLQLFMRDDLLSWHASKTPPRSEKAERAMQSHLQERVERNVQSCLANISRLVPNHKPMPRSLLRTDDALAASVAAVRQARFALEKKRNGAESFHSSCNSAIGGGVGGAFGACSTATASKAIDRNVFALIAAATNEDNLCQMPATWQPWL